MRVILYPLAGLYIIEGGVARDKQDVRDRRDSKFWVRSSENLELRTSNLGRLAFPVSLAWRLRDFATNGQE